MEELRAGRVLALHGGAVVQLIREFEAPCKGEFLFVVSGLGGSVCEESCPVAVALLGGRGEATAAGSVCVGAAALGLGAGAV